MYDYVTNEPSRKFASEVIQRLKEEEHEIYIVTARYATNTDTVLGSRMRSIVRNWLKEENIYYDNIIFSPEDKLDTCKQNHIDVMAEDKVENINSISTIIPVICFDRGSNRICSGKNIHRVYNWYDIYHLIHDNKI